MYRKPIVAPEGYVYTNGKEDYGKVIYIGEGRSKVGYYLITDEEYQKILEEELEKTEEGYELYN